MAIRGRNGQPAVTPKRRLELVNKYIELGNFAEVAREMKCNRATATNNIRKFIEENPEEYQKLLDAYLARNKMMMIHQNAHTTEKALTRIDEMLDDPDCCRSIKDMAIAYGTLYDKGALMKGESTQNSAIVIKMAGNIEELSK